MSDEKERTDKLREKIIDVIKKIDLSKLIKIARILGIPIMKDP